MKRVDGHYLAHEIQHQLHFEKGILYTIKELLLRPGRSIRQFISDDRNRLVKPVAFVVIASLVYSTINHFFHIEDGYVSYKEADKSAVGGVFEWMQHHYGYANIIMGVFIALWTKLFFRKHNYNFFEILIVLCFVMGIGMLIFSVFNLIEAFTKIKLMTAAGVIGFAYCTWGIAQFFGGRKVMDYVKSLSAYLLGYLTSMILAILLGVLLDIITKH
ncbi:DUF3667 domain-containing protein [Mucilaginibacter conchicola]|uniref:DUF3667 domain-containing protein n=1 Tax=Mucilaginibacter conchicola TaxID=2303333 RepID=UPI001F18009B|nr:DUF3667 domain-containing protein [Mucilaginibacter conchicola]